MSGALVPPADDEIRVKLGTDAFESQTLPSRISRTPATTHIRNISRHYRLPSGDMSGPSPIDSGGLTRVTDPNEWLGVCSDQCVQDIADVHAREHHLALGGHADIDSLEDSVTVPAIPGELLSLPSPPAAPSANVPQIASCDLFIREPSRPDRDTPLQDQSLHIATAPSLARPSPVVNSVEMDEQNWRQFLEVDPDPYSEVSIVVLRSSSQHLTASTMIPPAACPSPQKALLEQDHVRAEEPETDEAQRSPNRPTPSADQSVSVTSHGGLSPSASLLQIQRLVNLIPPRTDLRNETVVDEDMWRRFVIGSQGSDNSSSTHRTPRVVREICDSEIEPISSINGSDKATVATSRPAATTMAEPSETSDDCEGKKIDIFPLQKSLSVVARASTIHHSLSDEESQLLEVESEAPERHTLAASLDPRRRFRKPVDIAPVARISTRSGRVAGRKS
jgi:hypothetical protein